MVFYIKFEENILIFTTSLKKNVDFLRVYRRGFSIANKNLIIYILKNNTNSNYLGIVVSKKVGNSVVRSRVTRLIRENYRLYESNLLNGFNIVIVARNTCKGLSYLEIKSSLIHLFKKHNIIKK